MGAPAGLLVRRTLLAVSVTGEVTGAVLMVMGSLRWSLIPVRTVTGPGEQSRGQDMPLDAFMTDMGTRHAAVAACAAFRVLRRRAA
ncbi:hypothetical protein [Streptomyces altiplanensis]